jgi:hypothetical protein
VIASLPLWALIPLGIAAYLAAALPLALFFVRRMPTDTPRGDR